MKNITCPHCGNHFDADSVEEKDFQSRYDDWIAWGREEMIMLEEDCGYDHAWMTVASAGVGRVPQDVFDWYCVCNPIDDDQLEDERSYFNESTATLIRMGFLVKSDDTPQVRYVWDRNK